MTGAYVLAWVLPLVVGVAIYAAFFESTARARRSTAVGYGALFGFLLAAAVTSIVSRSDTAHAWRTAAPWLVAAAVIAIARWWLRRRGSVTGHSISAEGAEGTQGEGVRTRWQWWLMGALLATLVARALIIVREIWLRPLYPWDAWSAWAIEPKTWMLLGHYVPFGSIHDWAAAPATLDMRTFSAWFYPDALPWLDVWFASAAGGWIEPLVNMPWVGAWIGLLFGHYGQWRTLGLSRWRALLAVYVLASLPLLTVHAAVAGYADLWVAALFGFALLAWMRWLQGRDRRQLALALVCATALPFIKLEGWVWAAALLLSMGFGALSPRWRLRGLAATVVAIAILFAGGTHALFVTIGWVDANGEVLLERAGPFALLTTFSWHGDALMGAVNAFFALPNWHLFWWILPFVVIWRWRELVAREWLRLPALLLLACFGALMFLFLATAAADWAQSFTAINRLVLQLTPAVCSLAALLLRDAMLPATANDTDRQPAARSDPA